MNDMPDHDTAEDHDRPAIRRWQRPEYGTLMLRALQLRCPRCGEGHLFRRWFAMHERCSHCGLKFERAPGYYLGSSYINYGLTAVALMIAYVLLHYRFQFSNKDLAAPLAGFCVVFPLLAFRHARALWLAMDCRWDPGMMTDEED